MSFDTLIQMLTQATIDTAYMVGFSTALTVIFGLPLGVLLILTDEGGLLGAPWLHRTLGAIVNVGRSLPFIILLVAVIPLTRWIVGTTIGTAAAIVPLTLAAVPFFARVCETSLREVDRGLIEAAQAMGCTEAQIVYKVLIPEALPSLVLGVTITIISLLSYSAVAGAVGAGGLGDLAIRYGYQRFDTTVMAVTVALLIVMVQAIQWLGNHLSRRLRVS